MALKGSLRDFSTAQILNLVVLARMTGMLVIEAPGQTAQLAFRSGKLIYAHIDGDDDGLTAILLQAGKLTAERAEALKARAANAGDKEIGLLLINSGYVKQSDILASVSSHALEVVHRLLTWVEGAFRFEPAGTPGSDKITVPIDLENVITEGARRRPAP